MNTSFKIIWAAIGIILVLGAMALAFWDIPAPTAEVRKDVAIDFKRP